MRKFVSYLRVSTAKQGRSGLGLEAQKAAIESYLNGGEWTITDEFIEVESGKNDDRPMLQEALKTCRMKGAELVIAKLDRLSRDAHFLLGLQKAGVEFTCADMPEANKMTVGIMAIVAQQEREAISKRTKEALAAAKARGQKLGSPDNLKDEHRAKGRAEAAKSIKSKAQEFAREVCAGYINQYQAEGLSLNRIAVRLNDEGVLTARKGKWTARTVKNALEQYHK
jgi:DNA invertase Pin-like site-specific DNA recombinase